MFNFKHDSKTNHIDKTTIDGGKYIKHFIYRYNDIVAFCNMYKRCIFSCHTLVWLILPWIYWYLSLMAMISKGIWTFLSNFNRFVFTLFPKKLSGANLVVQLTKCQNTVVRRMIWSTYTDMMLIVSTVSFRNVFT